MKNPLNHRLLRELRSNAGRYAAIVIILVAMISVVSGFLTAANGVRVAFEDARRTGRVEDGSFETTEELSEGAYQKIEDLDVKLERSNYVDFGIEGKKTLRVFANRAKINLPTMCEGQVPSKENEIALDRLFAENIGLSMGDTIEVDDKKFTVVGLMALPDYSSLFKENTDLMMDSLHFGVALVTEDTFKNYPESEVVYHYMYRLNDRDSSKEEAYNRAEDIKACLVENQMVLTGFLTADLNQGISYVEEDMGSDVPMMLILLSIILVIVAFVFIIIILSTVEQESAVIGTLLASGYHRRELVSHYMKLPVRVTLASAAAGNVLGYAVMPGVFENIYYHSYSLPPMTVAFHLQAFLLTTVLPIGFMLLVNFLALTRVLRISPLRFLRGELKGQKDRRAVKLPAFAFPHRFRLRIIIQNKGSYLVLFAGIVFASFLLTFGLGLRPMFTHYVDTIRNMKGADYQYILKQPEEIKDSQAEKFAVQALDTYYKAAGKDLEITFYGISENSSFHNDISESDFGQDKVVLNEGAAKKLGVKEGDGMTFKDPSSGKKYKLTISGIYDYPAGMAAFMNIEDMNQMLDRDTRYFNGYFSDQKLSVTEENLVLIITPEELAKAGDQMLESFGQMVPICVAVAVIVYLVLMYILAKQVMDKNTRYISFMKVMGYRFKEIRRLYLNATTLVVFLSLLGSLPLSFYGVRFAFAAAFIKANGYMEIYLPGYFFVEIVIVGMISYAAIHLIQMRRAGKISMSETLKGRE